MSRGVPLASAGRRVAARLAAARRVALFTDFDGTLAPIVRHPDQARLPAPARRELRRLSRKPRFAVGVVSGRSLRDLRRRVALPGLYYIGSHGLEWSQPGRRLARVNPRTQTRIRRMAMEIEAELGALPGVFVEPKTVSVAVHYRNAPARVGRRVQHWMRRRVRKLAGRWRLLEGKKVVELLPPGRMSKGRAVLELVARLARKSGPRPLVVYLGDDVTDESVFARLRRGDVGIHVGANDSTRAAYRLRSPADVVGFLKRLNGGAR